MIFLSVILLIALLFIFMIMPSLRKIEMPCERFAHRGLHDGRGIPENSKAAFINAHDNSFGVELDVQYTKDRKLVVIHDNNINRVCGLDVNVRDLTYEELLSHPLYGGGEKVPLFSEVLEIMDGLPIICEIKTVQNKPDEEICREVAQRQSSYKGKMLIESFNPFVVQWFKKNRPDIIRGQLALAETNKESFANRIAMFLLKHLLVNVLSRPDFIAYRYTDDSFGYMLCRALFKPVCIAWTPRGQDAIKQAEEKYKYIIFEMNENKTEQ